MGEVRRGDETTGRARLRVERKILGGPIVWSPGVDGAVVVSQRGGDFLFDSGQDLAVGYDHHDADAVHLYIEQSFSFRVATPEAAVANAPRMTRMEAMVRTTSTTTLPRTHGLRQDIGTGSAITGSRSARSAPTLP